MKYQIKEVAPQIFCVIFDEHYDLNMTFFRWQEFYESSDEKIRRKKDKLF